MNRKKNFSVFEILFSVILFLQFLLLIIVNLTQIKMHFDSDAGMIMNHIMMIVKEKSLLIPDWVYPSTLEFDSTAFFALPIYLITRNIYLSLGLSNILLCALLSYSILYLFDGSKKIYPILTLNLLLIPYTVGALDYYNMLFYIGAQYCIKVTVPILLLGLMLHLRNEKKEKKDVKSLVAFILYLILLFVTSFSSGVYVFVCGLLPLLLAYSAYKFFNSEKIKKNEIILFSGTVLCSLIGILLNTKAQTAKGNGMVFVRVENLWNNIQKCFFGLFQLLGSATTSSELKVISSEGIELLIKLGVTLSLIVFLIIAIILFIKDKKDLFLLLGASVTVWNFMILCITDTRYGADTFEYRYHLIGLIPMFCIMTKLLLDGLERLKKRQQITLAVFGLLVLVYLNITGIQSFKNVDEHAELKEIISYCKELDVDTVFFLDDNQRAENCRVLDQSETVNYLVVHGDGKSFVRDYYQKYNGLPIAAEDNYAVVVDYSFFPWEENVDFNGFVNLKRINSFEGTGVYVKAE